VKAIQRLETMGFVLVLLCPMFARTSQDRDRLTFIYDGSVAGTQYGSSQKKEGQNDGPD
jgi:hypothetical protein